MILKFNRKGTSFGVYSETGELKFNIKLELEYSFYAEIFDELFVSQLAEIKLTEKGYLISAFDSPVGLMRKSDFGYSSEDGGITLKDLGERGYLVELRDDTARIVTSGSSVAMQTENEANAILLIALGLMLISEQEKHKKAEDSFEEKPQVKKKINIQFAKMLDAFFEAVGKITLSGGKSLWQKRRVHGKAATALVCAIILSAVLFLGGILGATINTNRANKYQKTVATVYVLGSKAVARFSVRGYYYKIDVKAKHKTGYNETVYYTLDKNGEVDKCTFKKPNAVPFIVLSAISIATAVTLVFLLFLGLPKLPIRRQMTDDRPQMADDR